MTVFSILHVHRALLESAFLV